MKKTYLNPKTETMPLMGQMHLCEGSGGGGTQIGGGTVGGGDIPGDPSQNL